MTNFIKSNGSVKSLAAIILLFLTANVFLYNFADPSCYQIGGDCAEQTDRYGFSVARSLIDNGKFVEPEDTSQPYTNWPPVYPIIIVFFIFIGGQSAFYLLATFQLIALFVMGLLAKSIVQKLLGNFGLITLCLIIFNPNLLVNAHVVSADIFHALLVTISFFVIYNYAHKPTIILSIIFGLSIGLSVLIRPVTQIYIPLLIIIFPLVAIISKHLWVRAIFHGFIASLVAIILMMPWLIHMNNSGEGWRIGSNGAQYLFLLDNIKFMTKEMPGYSNHEFKIMFSEQKLVDLRERHSDWESLSKVQKEVIQLNYIKDHIMSWPFDTRVVLVALTKSVARFFLSGGEGGFHILLGIENSPRESPWSFYTTKLFSLTYSITLRIIGLIGIIELIRRRDYLPMFLIFGLVISFMAAHLVHGAPRFRIPVEPELIMLSVYGLAFIDKFYKEFLHKFK